MVTSSYDPFYNHQREYARQQELAWLNSQRTPSYNSASNIYVSGNGAICLATPMNPVPVSSVNKTLLLL